MGRRQIFVLFALGIMALVSPRVASAAPWSDPLPVPENQFVLFAAFDPAGHGYAVLEQSSGPLSADGSFGPLTPLGPVFPEAMVIAGSRTVVVAGNTAV